MPQHPRRSLTSLVSAVCRFSPGQAAPENLLAESPAKSGSSGERKAVFPLLKNVTTRMET
jgi:hypothetical protein